MPGPETQVALANREAIARGRILIVGFGPDLARALPDAVVFHQNYRAYLAAKDDADARFGAWLDTDERFDSVVVELPKATGRLRMLLAMARAVMAPDARLFVIGHNDAGIRSVGPHLRATIGEPEVLDYRAHCRVLVATLDPTLSTPDGIDPWRAEFVAELPRGDLVVRSYPGVFAHGRVDDGTSILLQAITGSVKGARVLDLGCGAGIIGAWAAREGASVTCSDVDAIALIATAETFAANALEGSAIPSDVYEGVEGRFTHLITNAPFHSGTRTTSAVASRLITEAPDHLDRGGEVWLVANRFLDYLSHFRSTFGSRFSVAFEDRRWRVYHARSG